MRYESSQDRTKKIRHLEREYVRLKEMRQTIWDSLKKLDPDELYAIEILEDEADDYTDEMHAIQRDIAELEHQNRPESKGRTWEIIGR